MQPQTILVASADPYRSKAMRDCLVNAGYQVNIRDSGLDVLRVIRQVKPILAVLEWNLPELSGLELTRMLRAGEQTSRIPIILMGPGLSDENRLLGYEAGADICMTGSFTPKVFVARVHALLRRANPYDLPVRY